MIILIILAICLFFIWKYHSDNENQPVLYIGKRMDKDKVRCIKFGNNVIYPEDGKEPKWAFSNDNKYIVINGNKIPIGQTQNTYGHCITREGESVDEKKFNWYLMELF